jgi:hypothetical protein
MKGKKDKLSQETEKREYGYNPPPEGPAKKPDPPPVPPKKSR